MQRGGTGGTAYITKYVVYMDDHGLGSMAIHLAHHCFSFNMRSIPEAVYYIVNCLYAPERLYVNQFVVQVLLS